MPQGGTCDTAGEERLIKMCHLNQLILDMGSTLYAIGLGSQGRSADQHVSDYYLAATVALSMVSGEAFHQHPRKFVFLTQKYPFPGNEDMVEYHQRLLASEFAVAAVHAVGSLQLPGIAGLSSIDHDDPFRVRGDGKGNRIGFVLLLHRLRGHDQMLVGVHRSGLVRLCAVDNDALVVLFHDAQIQIRIRLPGGRQAPIPLGIRHRAVHGQVVFLYIGHVVNKSLVILGAVFLIDLIGRGIDRVERVHAYASLEAGPCGLPHQPLHLHLLHQILSTLVKMAETVDRLSGQIGSRGHNIFIVLSLRQGIGHGDRMDGWTDNGMIHEIFHPFAEQIHLCIQFP